MDDEQQLFLEEVMENYKNPRNKGEMENYTFKEHQKNISCGDVFDLFVKIENNKIIDVKYSGEGCAISTASFSMLSQELIQMSVDDAKKINKDFILDMLGIKISAGKMNCAMLSLEALENGLEGMEKK